MRLSLLFASLSFALLLQAQPLRDLAAQRKIHLGAAVDPSHFSESAYAATLAAEFNQAEPENAMKFGPIHTAPDTYNFAPADAIVSFAADHNMAVRGHTLVWYNQLPSWLTSAKSTSGQLNDILHQHIDTVVGHYAGKVYAWDVVNEAFNDNGTIRSYLWSDTPGIGLAGTAYLEQAFRWAHAADPNALLFYNDYNVETVNTKSDTVYKMAQDFLSRGVPIHGVGLQMHLTANEPSIASIDANIKRFTALGLQVHITELDVRLPVDSSGAASAASLATQARIYSDIVATCLKYPRCTGIQTWGFTDKYSWIPGTYPGFGAALPFDLTYRQKSAYTAIQTALAKSVPVASADGLVNAASYQPGPIAPGELVALFGATFGPGALTLPASATSTDLAGARLFFDGIAAPILYAIAGQLGAMVPAEIAGRAIVQVEYEYQGLRAAPFSASVVAAQPGIFTFDQSGSGPAAILDAHNTPISAANPAAIGDFVSIYGTAASPIATPVEVRIANISCPVSYAGESPGQIPGLLQINARVAPGIPSGSQPVSIAIGGFESPQGPVTFVR